MPPETHGQELLAPLLHHGAHRPTGFTLLPPPPVPPHPPSFSTRRQRRHRRRQRRRRRHRRRRPRGSRSALCAASLLPSSQNDFRGALRPLELHVAKMACASRVKSSGTLDSAVSNTAWQAAGDPLGAAIGHLAPGHRRRRRRRGSSIVYRRRRRRGEKAVVATSCLDMDLPLHQLQKHDPHRARAVSPGAVRLKTQPAARQWCELGRWPRCSMGNSCSAR